MIMDLQHVLEPSTSLTKQLVNVVTWGFVLVQYTVNIERKPMKVHKLKGKE